MMAGRHRLRRSRRARRIHPGIYIVLGLIVACAVLLLTGLVTWGVQVPELPH